MVENGQRVLFAKIWQFTKALKRAYIIVLLTSRLALYLLGIDLKLFRPIYVIVASPKLIEG